MSAKEKIHRCYGGRRDAERIRKIDAMHFIMPVILPGRTDNEAFISETVDLTNVNEYLAKRNAESPEYHYNLFQLIVTALMRTVHLRPKMNRFIANNTMYQRNDVTASFVIKKEFKDDGKEGMAFITARPEDTLESIHNELYRQITENRDVEMKDSSTEEGMDFFFSMPRLLSHAALKMVRVLDRHDRLPYSLVRDNPYYATLFLSNLGSIRLRAGYHHLANFGSNSVFVVIGEIKKRPVFDENGEVTLHDTVTVGITVDERIADGYYYSKTIRLFKNLMDQPELLEQRMDQPVEY